MLLKSFVLVVLYVYYGTSDHLISNREGPRVPSTHRASFTKASHPFQITGKTELLGYSLGRTVVVGTYSTYCKRRVQKLLKNSTLTTTHVL